MKNRYYSYILTALISSSVASAATGTWSGAANGTWDTSSTNWTGVTGSAWDATNGPNNTATFNLASLAAAISGSVTTNGITFSTTGSLSGGTINLAGTTPGISVDSSQTGTISSTISGSAGLTKSSAGTLILSGANDYTGGTAINAGTLQINTGGTLGSTSGALSMGTGSSGVIGTVGNLTVNTDTQAGALSFVANTSNTTTASNIGLLSIASGKTLTVSSLSAGVASTTGTTYTAISTGSSNAGTITVTGDVAIGPVSAGGNSQTVVNLSGLAAFNAGSGSGNFRVGFGNLSDSTLTLASTANTINVATISVGETTNNGNSSRNSIVNLGSGTNLLQANTINIGTQKASGVIQFAGSNGSVVISGTGGVGSANISLGNANSSGSYQPGSLGNRLLLAGHTATVNAGNVIIGNRTSTGVGTVTSQMTFDTGTFNASSIILARATNGHASSASAVNGTLTLGTTSASTGITTVSGNVLLASHRSSAAGVQTATGVLNILGGTLNVNTAASSTGGILDNSNTTTGTSTTTLTLDGGTLNLNGGIIGGDNSSGNRAITNLNFRSGTLKNVAQINNGAGLTKTSVGKLILDGTNTYTGTTTVSAGSLVVNGSITSTSVVVESTGSLGGSGLLGSAVLSGSGSINPGNSPGVLTASSVDLGGGLDFNFEFNVANGTPTWNAPTASGNDVLRLTGGTPFTGTMISSNIINIFLNVGSLTVGDTFTGGFYTDVSADFMSVLSGATVNYFLADVGGLTTYEGNTFTSYTGPLTFEMSTVQRTADFGDGDITGRSMQFTVVPETSVSLLGGLSALLLLRRRRSA